MTFAQLQPVFFRRSEAERYEQQGWFVAADNHGMHTVLLKTGDTVAVRDENIRASDRNIDLQGVVIVFRKNGKIVLSGPHPSADFTLDLFKNNDKYFDHELLAVVDAGAFKLSCVEGHGLHPRKRKGLTP